MEAPSGRIHTLPPEAFDECELKRMAEDDTRFADLAQLGQRIQNEESMIVPVDEAELPKVKRMSYPRRKGWMRNRACPCGSGKKFKACCWNKLAGGVKS